MTNDQTVKNQETDKEKISSSGVFGGAEDVFDNDELFDNIGKDKKTSAIEEDNQKDFDPFGGEEKETFEEHKNEEIEDKIDVLDKILDTKEENNSENEFDLELGGKEKNGENDQKENNVDEKSDDRIMEEEKNLSGSDLLKKFRELVLKTKDVYSVGGLDDWESLQVLGGDTEKIQTIYNIRLLKNENVESILINRIENFKETNEEIQHGLQFKEVSGMLHVILDEHLLYDEAEHLVDDESKKMQVMDKLNKFIFLVEEELKALKKRREEKDRIAEERKKLRDVFRNF